jgi:hypothetical protein
MYKKNQGYGICGSKNIYSSKVRLDNWVEDTIGMELGQTERPPYKLYNTVTKEAHCDPSNWPEPQNLVNMPTPLELKTKNKDGMPYSILFEHSNNSPAEVSLGTGTVSICSLLSKFFSTGTVSNNNYENNESAGSSSFSLANIVATAVESNY